MITNQIIPTLTERDAKIVSSGAWLEDTHMDIFGALVKKFSNYVPQDTWKVQCPDMIEPVSPDTEHIQILFSGRSNIDGHWICSYYDKKCIHIFDSLNKKTLHNDQKLFLCRLFPFLQIDDTNKNIKFFKVQQQPNNNDCGVFSIAFATSLLYGIRPDKIKYDHSKMRSHLLTILQTQNLVHFPQDNSYGPGVTVLPIQVVQARRYRAVERRTQYKYEQNNLSVKCDTKKENKKNLSATRDTKKQNNLSAKSDIKKTENKENKLSVKRHSTNENNKKSNLPVKKENKKELSVKCGTKKENNEKNDLSAKSDIKENENKENKLSVKCHSTNENNKESNLPVKKENKKELSAKCGTKKENNKKNELSVKCKTKKEKENKEINLSAKCDTIFEHNEENKLSLKNDIINSINDKVSDSNDLNIIEKNYMNQSDSILNVKNLKRQLERLRWSSRKVHVNYKRRLIYQLMTESEKVQLRSKKSNLYKRYILSNRAKKMNRYISDPNKLQRKRMKYILDSVNERAQSRKRYLLNLEKYRELKRKNYATNLIKNRELKRKNYVMNLVENRELKRKSYVTNLVENRELKRKNYATNAIEIRPLKRRKYAANAIKNRELKRKNYATNLVEYRTLKRKRYAINVLKNRQLKRNKYCQSRGSELYRKRIFNRTHPEKKQLQNRMYYKRNKEALRIKNKMRIAKNISFKYKKFIIRANTIVMKYSAEKCINLIAEEIEETECYAERKIEAQRIFKWCLHVRENHLYNIRKTLKSLRDKAELHLTQLEKVNDIDSKRDILCGTSKHTATSEAYFAETMYNDVLFPKLLIINEKGQATNVLPLIENNDSRKKLTWYCSSFCKKQDESMLERYTQLLKAIFECTLVKNVPKLIQRIGECTVRNINVKLGHSHGCYIKPDICRSLLLAINFLSPHFPLIRNIGRMINFIINNNNKIAVLDKALETGDLSTLYEIIKSAEEEAKAFKHDASEIDLNEDRILSTYAKAFNVLTKRYAGTPRHICVSCEKLHFWRDITSLARIRKPISGKHWKNLEAYLEKESIEADYICHYCIKYFRKNSLPPTCILNNLYVSKVPEMFASLNDYEKILIQRAKAFQCVQRMGAVANKKIPHKQMIQKLKGRTFHLPLPVEETLKKLCPSTAPINCSHEMYILVRGIPTKSKIVWENLVDLKKIFQILKWFKENNPLYSEIILPDTHTELLNENLNEIEFDVNDNENNKENAEKHAALLTQITDPDAYYEHYSIYPMYEKRKNETSTDMYQMLKVEAAPLDNRYKQLDLLCFPDLYPYGVNGLHEERNVSLREYDFVKSRLMSKHSQFRLNIQYIFYLLNNANMRQINSGIYHKMNVVNPRYRYTAAEFLASMNKKELEGNLNTIFGKLPNTRQYWNKVRNDVNAMTREYGPATWFLTFSPSEWLWTDLTEYIKEVSPTLNCVNSVNELIALDPVSAARFIQNKFLAMLDFICSSDNPIGKVKHYFMRREYQSRGMPHCHLMIWIEDAPVIGKSSNEEVIKFILKYITCKVPNKKMSPLLHRRVTTHQEHHHNSYCMRRKKTKTGFIRVCRFGFSRPVTDKLVLRDVAVSVANRRQLKSKSRLYDLPREDREKNINDYNPAVLLAWEGNMDIQFIGEKSTLLNWYCTKYTTKTECSYGVDTFDIINSTKSLRSCLWNIALRSLSNRECGALEAADTLLGISLHSTDRDTTIRWLDVNQIRSRKVRTRKEIEALEGDSTDIFCHSFIDNFYPNRPEELESSNLYDFAKWYDISRVKPSGKCLTIYEFGTRLYLKKRKHGYLINHYTYNMNVQPEKYYYSLLLLFKPWRDLDELKANYDTYAEAFDSVKSVITEGLQYHERLADIQKGVEQVKELIERNVQKIEQNEKSMNPSDNQLDCLPIEAEGAMQEFKEAGNVIAELDLSQMISELNIDQKRIFDIVTKSISNPESCTPLRLYVSGEGGTGKSFLIKTIRCWAKQVMNKDTAVTAPTGIAAFNIDGLTVHRLFQLPVEHGHTPKYRSLSDAVLKTLRDELKDTVLFIIDEISMISNITFMYINLRLTEIFDTADSDDGWFGHKHILLFGDLLQLPPVHEDPAYVKMSKDKNEKLLGSLAPINLWVDLFKYDELTINMRQKGDNAYRELLSRIRLGIATDSDVKLLMSRSIKFVSSEIRDRLLELCNYIKNLSSDAICLLPTCYLCDVLNTTMLEQIPGPEIKLIARDVMDCANYLKKQVEKLLDKYDEDSSRTAGLNRCITVKIGAKIMIRRNIDVTLGLVNGTIGEITEITRESNGQDVESVKILLSSGKIHTIERTSCKFEIMDKAFVCRHQFPISLSYGVTIHKSQGLTVRTAVVDAGNSVFSSGQTYVALSRISTSEGLHLINFDPHSIQASEPAILEYNRLRNLYRPDLSSISVEKCAWRKKNDFIWAAPRNITNQQIVHDDLDLPCNTKGFINSDNVSCYANATLQCILYCRLIRNELLKRDSSDELKILVESYTNKSTMLLNSLGIRQLLGGTFLQNIQQDASEFLLALVDNCNDIKMLLEHQLSHTVRCKTCNKTTITNETNFILSLPVHSVKKSTDLQQMINETFSRWQKLDGSCSHCKGNERLAKTDVTSTKKIVIIQLILFSMSKEGPSKITNCSIKAIPTTAVKLAEKTYKIVSAIFHHGETIHAGHYTSMIRDKKSAWISIDDQVIKKKQWPRGAKGAYLFFLESSK